MNDNVDISGDLVIRGNLSVFQTKNTETINTTVNNYEIIMTNDLSINGDIKTSGDASFGGNLTVIGDTSLNVPNF